MRSVKKQRLSFPLAGSCDLAMAASRGDSCWQAEKTVLECNRIMLENEIATDVCFEVGPHDQATAIIRAHKYMLIARSPVFEAMFTIDMRESKSAPGDKIRIEDIEPWIFKKLLSFIYYEDTDVNQVSALPLMYAAKKYLLQKLVEHCGNCLQKDLTIQNVGEILNLSLIFCEDGLKKRCLELITSNSADLLRPEIFNNFSYEALETILSMDSLSVNETLLYRACINWAKAQLKHQQSTNHPSDDQIRQRLGDLIYKIRFPVMNVKEFADIAEDDVILTYEEQSSIFCYIGNQHKRKDFRFNCDRRFLGEEFVDRTVTCDGTWGSGPDAIDVKTNHRILVTGIALFTEQIVGGTGYNVDIEILKSTESLYRISTSVPYTGNSAPYKIAFGKPVAFQPHFVYTISANSGSGKTLYRGVSCQGVCNEGGVMFTFSTTSRNNNGTNTSVGQIPRIYFRPMAN